MKASEAKQLAETSRKLAPILCRIRQAAEGGATYTHLYLTDKDVRTKLTELGYVLKDEIDDDSDYRGTWISW